MTKRILLYILVLAASFASCACASVYNVRFLNNPTGLLTSKNFGPCRINDSGQIVGVALDTSGYVHGVMWQPDGSTVDFGRMSSVRATFSGINIHGDVVGTDASKGFMLTSDGTKIDLLASGYGTTRAMGINDSGIAVGQATSTSAYPVKWSVNGIPTFLQTSGSGEGGAMDINESGQIAGWYKNINNINRACTWQPDGTLTDLATPQGYQYSWATFNNNTGQALGFCSQSLSSSSVGILWDADGSYHTFSNSNWNISLCGLNDSGAVLGAGSVTDLDRAYPFIYTPDKGFDIISVPGISYIGPYGINNNGTLVGVAYDQATGSYRPCVFELVPEPSSIIGLIVGFMSTGALLRSKKH